MAFFSALIRQQMEGISRLRLQRTDLMLDQGELGLPTPCLIPVPDGLELPAQPRNAKGKSEAADAEDELLNA